MSNSSILLYKVRPLQARVDLGVMALKGYTAFLKAPLESVLHFASKPKKFYKGDIDKIVDQWNKFQ